MARIMVPSSMSLGVFLSYKCNSRCRHCMYACSPRWDEDWISEESLARILDQLAGRISPSPYGAEAVGVNHGLHFSGGEPFLDFELLLRAVEMAEERGIPSTFVETNCFWCTSEEVTREKLSLLKQKGLRGILLSVNPFCLEYVPFERAERAVRVGTEVFATNSMVYQLEYYGQFKRLGIKGRLAFEEYLRRVGPEQARASVELLPIGKVPYMLGGFFPKYPAQAVARHGGPSCLREWHNHVDNYGNYVPGYCGGISLGDARRLDQLCKEGVDAETHPILGFLAAGDLRGLLAFAIREHRYEEKPEGYISPCHLCVDVRKRLVDKGYEELRPKEFYRQLASLP